MKYLSKSLFFWTYLVAELIGYPFMVSALIASEGKFELEYLSHLLIGELLLIYCGILVLVLVHKMWKIIPFNLSRTTPGKAVGFMIIPLYNFYWVFTAIWGWTVDYNNYMRERQSERLKVSEGLGLAISIFYGVVGPISMILSFAGQTLISLAMGAPVIVLFPIFIFQVCSKLNELPDEIKQNPPGASYQEPVGKRGLGVASLVLGILSIVIPYLGLILGIIGIVLAVKQRSVMREGLSTAGLVTSIIGTVLWGITVVVLLVLLSSV